MTFLFDFLAVITTAIMRERKLMKLFRKRKPKKDMFSPEEVLLNPIGEALIEELKHWTIKRTYKI